MYTGDFSLTNRGSWHRESFSSRHKVSRHFARALVSTCPQSKPGCIQEKRVMQFINIQRSSRLTIYSEPSDIQMPDIRMPDIWTLHLPNNFSWEWIFFNVMYFVICFIWNSTFWIWKMFCFTTIHFLTIYFGSLSRIFNWSFNWDTKC